MQLTLHAGMKRLQVRVTPLGSGRLFYIAPNIGSGAGTIDNPYGLADLQASKNDGFGSYVPGDAFSALQPGDTLYFRAGTYTVQGSAAGVSFRTLLCPPRSGTATQPITVRSYPGETVTIVPAAGCAQSLFGTVISDDIGQCNSYTRFIGFTASCNDNQIAFVDGGQAPGGTGNELGYCDFTGGSSVSASNPCILYISSTANMWIHHNNLHGQFDTTGRGAAMESYGNFQLLAEDNYVHNNMSGLFDKDSGAFPTGNQSTYRRNWCLNNPQGNFVGNNNAGVGKFALYYIYDNVLEVPGSAQFNLGNCNVGSQVYNNLCIVGSRWDSAAAFWGYSGDAGDAQASVWNNITLATDRHFGFFTSDIPFTASGPTAPLLFCDYNVYDGAPLYGFGGYDPNMTLAQMQANGFENHAYVDSDSGIFVDQVSYVLKPFYQTAGRYGDTVGPGISNNPKTGLPITVTRLRDVTRYGPGALI